MMRACIVIVLIAAGQVTWAKCEQYHPQSSGPCGCKSSNPPDVTCFDTGVPQPPPINLQMPSQQISGDLSGIASTFLLSQQQTKPLLPGPCPSSFPVWPGSPSDDSKFVRHIPVIQKYRNDLIETRTRHVPIIKKRFRTVVEPYTTHVPVLEKFCHPVEETVVRSVPVFRPFFPSPQPGPVAIKFPSPHSPSSPSQTFTLPAFQPSLQVASSCSCVSSHAQNQQQPSHRFIPVSGPVSSQFSCNSFPSQLPCYSY